MTENRQWLINGRPRGRGLVDDDFKKVVTPVPEVAEGHVLVKNEILGFDPAQKGWMENIGGYVAPTEIGEVMRASGIGTVVESRHPEFSVGDKVMGGLRWQAAPQSGNGGLSAHYGSAYQHAGRAIEFFAATLVPRL